MSIKDRVLETEVERAGDQWLVSSTKHEIVMSYGQHDTATQMQLPNKIIFMKVPLGTIVQIHDIILHHLHSEDYRTDLQVIDTFCGHLQKRTPSDSNYYQKGPKLFRFHWTKAEGSVMQSQALQLLPRLTLCGWVITAMLLSYIQALHNKLDTLTDIPDRFRNRPCGVLSLPSTRAARNVR